MREIAKLLVFLVVSAATALASMPFILFARPFAIRFFPTRWARWALNWFEIRVEAEGLEHARDARLIMANHSSHLDVLCIYAVVPSSVRFVAKHELMFIPFFGWALAMGAAIIIDRRHRKRALRSLARARRAIEAGEAIAFFPEGTRTPPGELGPLKKGPFFLAAETQVPIVPIGLTRTGELWPPNGFRLRPGTVQLRVGPPICTSDVTNDDSGRQVLAERVAEALSRLMRSK